MLSIFTPHRIHTLFLSLSHTHSEALVKVIDAVSASSGVDEVMQRIIEAAYSLVDVERILLFVVDDNTKELVLKVSTSEETTGLRLPMDNGIVGKVATTGNLINISDPSTDPLFDAELDTRALEAEEEVHNLLTLPIKDRSGAVAAVLQGVNKTFGSFNEEDEVLMNALAITTGEILRKAQVSSPHYSSHRS